MAAEIDYLRSVRSGSGHQVIDLKHCQKGALQMFKKIRATAAGLVLAGAAALVPAVHAAEVIIIIICDATDCLIIVIT
ncbi:hypothetical protein LU699_13105 [Luteimonas fraxinea]|uniref:ESPR domain-containing protein n=1 Tax=Luteimonas fraxinea TaxID=2901869 RepID=A0ABS8UEW6_9GAMM|nr:hypothetical protein [Luteimonas fraxinea]MCD9098048.1 hypothetical protein [Luteimonas fraxinea]UHH09227.1 hypothetical protein LU699_13105 [Luteimonas fraxinea]